MKIEGNIIFFKSSSTLYEKELKGIKPNTVRFMSTIEEIEQFTKFHAEFEEGHRKKIVIHKAETIHCFERDIKDISQIPGMWCFVISW